MTKSVFKDENKMKDQLLHECANYRDLKAKAKKSAKAFRDELAESQEKIEKLVAALMGEGDDGKQPELGAAA